MLVGPVGRCSSRSSRHCLPQFFRLHWRTTPSWHGLFAAACADHYDVGGSTGAAARTAPTRPRRPAFCALLKKRDLRRKKPGRGCVPPPLLASAPPRTAPGWRLCCAARQWPSPDAKAGCTSFRGRHEVSRLLRRPRSASMPKVDLATATYRRIEGRAVRLTATRVKAGEPVGRILPAARPNIAGRGAVFAGRPRCGVRSSFVGEE